MSEEELANLENEEDHARELSQIAPALQLTPEQEQAVDRIVTWLENAPEKIEKPYQIRVAGLAGTGKTTIMKAVPARLRKYDAAPCAFTGKAASVLRRKGVSDASTIHRRMYVPEIDEKTKKTTWRKRGYINEDYWMVDEASMVSTQIYNDMCSFRLPMLFVGDHGQLEPVGENPNLMRDADIVLEKIHRQAEGNPILRLALNVRLGGGIAFPIFPCPDSLTITSNKSWEQHWNPQELVESQIICGFNTTRGRINGTCRSKLGYSNLIHVGEKVICLQNDAEYGIFNGQIFYVQKICKENENIIYVDLVDDLGYTYRDIPMWKEVFTGKLEMKEFDRARFRSIDTCFFDYGYCVTCHKSQGSEWKKVIVVEEYYAQKMFDIARWRYTAITRASERLVYCR
jgi:exodeoxyribonuclease-5